MNQDRVEMLMCQWLDNILFACIQIIHAILCLDTFHPQIINNIGYARTMFYLEIIRSYTLLIQECKEIRIL